MSSRICTYALLGFLVVMAGCRTESATPQTEVPTGTITSESLLRHIKVLSSDEFEGRAPGSPGEELTVAYLTKEFQRMGLKPGNPNGTYVQDVPLTGIASRTTAEITVGGKKLPLSLPADMTAGSSRPEPEISVENSDVVFVGYGIVAPEYGWDDYKGIDVRGKTIVMLVNDPQIPDPNDPSKLDSVTFKGKAMTYYGRWTYKYEIASEKGAAAAIIIHETGPAGYPYEVVKGSWSGENFSIIGPDGNAGRVKVESWMTEPKARELLKAAGQDFDQLKKAATRKDFRPVPLGAKATFHVTNRVRQVQSRNVAALIEGSDPKLKNEYVIYSAHWDHLGRDTTLAGDQIYNGALDNASGTAALLNVAEAFTRLPQRPKRSILFLAVTGEEQGLLGSTYYAENPLYPLAKTLAVINMDGLNPWGRTKDVVLSGYGTSTMEDLLAEQARKQGRVVLPDPEPEKGGFYRSDHFPFAKAGVPAISAGSGQQFLGKPADFGKKIGDAFTENDYHKPSDEIKPDWDLSGAVEDAELYFSLGNQIAGVSEWPSWKPGAEFKAKREASLRGAQH